jgi:AraC-type DNA-binding domain-containing proteins
MSAQRLLLPSRARARRDDQQPGPVVGHRLEQAGERTRRGRPPAAPCRGRAIGAGQPQDGDHRDELDERHERLPELAHDQTRGRLRRGEVAGDDGENHGSSRNARRPDRAPSGAAIRNAIDLVDRHPEQNRSVADIAAAVGTTARALQRGFNATVGMSPSASVRAVRSTGCATTSSPAAGAPASPTSPCGGASSTSAGSPSSTAPASASSRRRRSGTPSRATADVTRRAGPGWLSHGASTDRWVSVAQAVLAPASRPGPSPSRPWFRRQWVGYGSAERPGSDAS